MQTNQIELWYFYFIIESKKEYLTTNDTLAQNNTVPYSTQTQRFTGFTFFLCLVITLAILPCLAVK